MSTDVLTIPKRATGLTASFIGENSEVSDSDVSWDQVTLTARKLACLHRMSSELSEDAVISMADLVSEEIAYSFSEKEDDCGMNGDGTSTYGGMQGVIHRFENETLAGAVDAASGIDTFEEITTTDLAKCAGALPAYARRNAGWYCSSTALSYVFERLGAAGGGSNVITLAQGLGMTPTFMGYPIRLSEKMPTSTGDLSNKVMLMYGDLSLAATMGVRRDVRILSSNERYLEYDQVGFLGSERFDIKVHDLGDSTTAGPVVALMGE